MVPAQELDAPQPLTTRVGWGVLHLFSKVTDAFDVAAAGAAEERARKDGNQVVTAAILGHKADLCVMALGPDLWQLRQLQTAVTRAGAEPVSSYVSMTEVSEYASEVPEQLRQARLFPELPPEDKRTFCFYPMSKRRGERSNWYTMGFKEREALMRGHGKIGRTFRGRVLQLITGSTGLDDWEWGVTLFALTPDDIKACVYEMRFDEVSARFAEFGPFYFGIVADLDQVVARVARA